MRVAIKFDTSVDIIDVPQHIADDLDEYRVEFSNWLSDRSVDHKYWMYKDGEKYGLCYRSNALIEWLNMFPLKDNPEKAEYISTCFHEHLDDSLPSLFF